jgi:O-antigen/teichoic acid export membrane protein
MMISDSLHSLLLIAIPIFVAIELLAEPLILLISGEAFIAAIPTLRIESLIIIPVTIANVAGIQVLVGSGKEDKYLISILSGACAFILSGLLFIPSMKQNGAAISMVSAETVGASLELYFGRDYFQRIKCTRWLLSSLFSSALMAVAIALILLLHLGSFASVLASFVCGVIIYLSILLLSRDSIILKIKDRIVSRLLHQNMPC